MRIKTAAALAALAMLPGSRSDAAIIQYGFSGTFSFDNAGLGLAGTGFSGTFWYDTNAVLLFDNGSVATYAGAAIQVTVGAEVIDVTSQASVRDEPGFPGNDERFRVATNLFGPQPANCELQDCGTLGGLAIRSVAVIFSAESDFFSDRSLPSSIPGLPQWDVTLFSFVLGDAPGDPLLVNGNLSMLTFVPEPTTALLLVSGLGGLAGRRRHLLQEACRLTKSCS